MTVISRRSGPTTSKWAPKYGGKGSNTVRVRVSSYEMDRPTSRLLGKNQSRVAKAARAKYLIRPDNVAAVAAPVRRKRAGIREDADINEDADAVAPAAIRAAPWVAKSRPSQAKKARPSAAQRLGISKKRKKRK